MNGDERADNPQMKDVLVKRSRRGGRGKSHGGVRLPEMLRSKQGEEIDHAKARSEARVVLCDGWQISTEGIKYGKIHEGEKQQRD